MGSKWINAGFPCVRYRKHQTRKNGVKFDHYFAIYYQLNGKRKEEGVGWASKGWTASKAYSLLNELQENQKIGEGHQTLAEKRELEEERRQEKKREKQRIEKESISFGQYFTDTYIAIAKTNKKTESYRKEEEHFRNWLKPVVGHMPLKKIYPLHLEKVKKSMIDAPRSPRSIEYVFATFRQCWNMARRDNIVDRESPSKQVKRPKINNMRIRFFTYDEADSLLAELKDRSIQLHDMALLSLHCGLRASETFRLQWGHVHLDRGTLDVMDAKGKKDRTAYLTEGTKEMLSGLEPGKKNDFVFPDRNKKKIRKISNAYWKVIDKLGLNDGVDDSRQKAVYHTLRHSYASWLVQGGEPLYTVQKLMGHSTLSQTERYAHLAQENLERAVQNFEKNLSKQKATNVINIKSKGNNSAKDVIG